MAFAFSVGAFEGSLFRVCGKRPTKQNIKMKLSKMFTLAGVTVMCATALFSQQAEAAKIKGAISFGGTAILNTNDALTATAVNEWHFVGSTGLPYVNNASQDFLPTLGQSVTFAAPWVFTAATPTLWSVLGFSFDLTSSVVTHDSVSVTVKGFGIMHKAGFDDTFGSFNFTTQNPGADPDLGGPLPASFSFSSSGNALPDGGSAMALLGIALLGVEGIRRKFLIA
jgi:hypothetical protein